MHTIIAIRQVLARLVTFLIVLSLLLIAAFEARAFYPYAPVPGAYFAQPFHGYWPGYSRPSYMQHPAWASYYPGYGHYMAPRYRAINYQRPWGSINGYVRADGNFWINIRLAGNYRDMQYLMALMQMSGDMQMQFDNTQPALPDLVPLQSEQWPM